MDRMGLRLHLVELAIEFLSRNKEAEPEDIIALALYLEEFITNPDRVAPTTH